MSRYKVIIAAAVLFVMLVSASFPSIPVSAASLSNLSNPSSSPNSAEAGFFSTALGQLLVNFLNKVFNINIKPDKPNAPGNSNSEKKEVLGFYAEWWDGDLSSYTSLLNNYDSISEVIPFWASVQDDASLSERGAKDHSEVVEFAHKHNIKVVLLVNNAKEGAGIETVLKNPLLRAATINNLEAYVKKNNLDGVNIDFEIVPPQSKNYLTLFVKELAARFKPQGYSVSIDVFPKTNENDDISAAYDYAALSQYADKIILMAYDNHGEWSGPGPVAGINWVDASLKYALDYIPNEKLYLGVAGYGYDWSVNGVESLEHKDAVALADKFKAAIQWDKEAKAPYYFYTDATGTRHTVWYENSFSSEYKIDLANKYGLGGVALWKLGEEDPQDWRIFRDKLIK